MRRHLALLLVLLLVPGIVHADVACDGTDDSLSTAVATSSFFSVSLGSMTAWYTPTATGTTAGTCWEGRTIVGDLDKNLILAHRVDSGNEQLCGYNFDGTSDNVIGPVFSLNTSHHLAWVHTGGNLTFYVDGTAIGTVASGDTAGLTSALALCAAGSGGNAASGVVSEVRVYNVALSVNEIVALAASRARRLGSTQPTGQWELGACADGASCDAASLLDLSGNSRHITGDNGANNTGLTGRASAVLANPFGVQ